MLKQIEREELRRKLAAIIPPVLVSPAGKYWRDWHLPARDTPARRGGHARAKVLPDKSAEDRRLLREPQLQNSHIGAHRLAQLGYEDVAVYPAASRTGWKPDFRDRSEARARS